MLSLDEFFFTLCKYCVIIFFVLGNIPPHTNLKKGVVLMTLRELLKSLNLKQEGYDFIQSGKIINLDDFCLIKIMEYLKSEYFLKDLQVCCTEPDIDEAQQLDKTLKLYFNHQYENGTMRLCLKIFCYSD